jgi:hypothetical protein
MDTDSILTALKKRASVLECASPLALFENGLRPKAAEGCRSPKPRGILRRF